MTDKQFTYVRATNSVTEVHSRKRKSSKAQKMFGIFVLVLALSFLGSPFIDKQIQKTTEWFKVMFVGFIPADNDYKINYLNTD
jgi:hypothetical protein